MSIEPSFGLLTALLLGPLAVLQATETPAVRTDKPPTKVSPAPTVADVQHPQAADFVIAQFKPKPAARMPEVCVYGGTSSGLLAAIAVAKSGRRVLVIEPSRWLGSMTGGGIRAGRDCIYPNDIGGLTKMLLREDAKLFIDASYEEDLMAMAGVHYTLGRESAQQYGESLGGIRAIKRGQTVEVDPYVKPGDPTSGLLPMISPEQLGNVGDASRHFLAYNFRLNHEDYPDTGGFPHQLYVRMGRRMLEWTGQWSSREEWSH